MDQSNQNQQESSKIKKFKSKYWKFAGGFLLIMIIIAGSLFVWSYYLSPEAKMSRKTAKNIELYKNAVEKYESAMKADTYGGKTPEETLQMFIDALQKEDIDLASKYFLLNEGGEIDKEIKEGLQKIKDEEKLKDTIAKLEKVKLTFKDDSGAIFKSYDKNNEVDILVDIQLNKYSNIWKIESL